MEKFPKPVSGRREEVAGVVAAVVLDDRQCVEPDIAGVRPRVALVVGASPATPDEGDRLLPGSPSMTA
jgi:hypothetical protein